MIALNVYKNLCRARPRNLASSLSHLAKVVPSDSSSAYAERIDSRLSESPIFRQCRLYGSDSPMQPGVRLPRLSNFPVRQWPAFFKTIRNFIIVNLVIRPYIDNEFDISKFISASKQAVYVVSNALARENYDRIEGLVTNDIINSLKQKISTLNEQQRELIAVNPEDIFVAFPYEVGITVENDTERRFVEITVVHHILRGSKHIPNEDLMSLNMTILPKYQERIFVCNYRFLREYTKGVDSPWIINMVNHFMPINL